ncbi:N-acetyltransferase [Niallia sp. NCCP-28]|uniref:GNAT family N-acetyltransferase n=1 Tax=Niallia sp. NCCP-28 TaxID=2934712 RepID=UPI0020833F34|nr:GNAT family N-acetyltransferase [Niallia sp. NCCP-28]GKU82810.1 N-acetyltransferase [Niallia sp. NCCP-28]
MITFEAVEMKNRVAFLPILLMADESEEVVKDYIEAGTLFAIKNEENDTIGCILIIDFHENTVEIKNIALIPEFRGRGYGKACIQHILQSAKKMEKERVLVGTANSSIENIAFYQKCGFHFWEIKKNFFADYPDIIVENGIQAIDMIYFEYKL